MKLSRESGVLANKKLVFAEQKHLSASTLVTQHCEIFQS